MSTSPAKRNRDILDAVAESICAWDLDSKITFWNAASEKFYGWSRDEAIGRNVIGLLKAEYGEPLSDCEAQLFDEGTWTGRCFRHAKSAATPDMSNSNRGASLGLSASALRFLPEFPAGTALCVPTLCRVRTNRIKQSRED